MCSGKCDFSFDDCDICSSLLNEIILFLGKDINESDIKVFKHVFDYIKEIPKKNPKLAQRKNGEHYLVHLIGTTRILLQITSGLSIEQLVIALLHDAIEDVEEIDIYELTRLFGYEIAKSVQKLSKKSISKEGLSEQEYELLKEKRNLEYVLSLKDLSDSELDVKFADRIHNLRTLIGLPRDFVEKYIDETIIYYLPLAKKRNKKAYDLILEEIIKLIKHLQKDELDNIFNNLETRVPLEELV